MKNKCWRSFYVSNILIFKTYSAYVIYQIEHEIGGIGKCYFVFARRDFLSKDDELIESGLRNIDTFLSHISNVSYE
jgi:hypothetical protein